MWSIWEVCYKYLSIGLNGTQNASRPHKSAQNHKSIIYFELKNGGKLQQDLTTHRKLSAKLANEGCLVPATLCIIPEMFTINMQY